LPTQRQPARPTGEQGRTPTLLLLLYFKHARQGRLTSGTRRLQLLQNSSAAAAAEPASSARPTSANSSASRANQPAVSNDGASGTEPSTLQISRASPGEHSFPSAPYLCTSKPCSAMRRRCTAQAGCKALT
jgi:hypothetical protein